MKLSKAALACALLSAPFAHAEMTAVTDKTQIYAYHVAVKQAVASAYSYKCSDDIYRGSVIAGAIHQGDLAWIDSSGAQPAIILGRTMSPVTRDVVRVITSADYKSVLNITMQVESLVDTDIGPNLLQPQIVKKWTVSQVVRNCVPNSKQ